MPWPQEELNFLRRNYEAKVPWSRIVAELNTTFGTSRTVGACRMALMRSMEPRGEWTEDKIEHLRVTIKGCQALRKQFYTGVKEAAGELLADITWQQVEEKMKELDRVEAEKKRVKRYQEGSPT